jgi:transcriptional regulator with XRE-family HTH domain
MNMDSTALMLKTKMLGALLREARKTAGKSLKQTAAMLGIGTSTLSSYELGKKGISLPELEQLAFHFDVPLNSFLSGQPARAQKSPGFKPEVIVSFRQKMIGALLRKHRQEAELSMAALGERLGISPSRISGFERGQQPIPVPLLEALAGELGHEMNEYIDTEGQGPVADWFRNQRSYESFRAMPQDIRNFLAIEESQGVIRLAMRLREVSVDKLRELSKLLREITDGSPG